jgi:hypothetical protein
MGMEFLRSTGAVAVCMRPLEGGRCLTDPYFYPIFEEASRLDLAIAVHIANGNPDDCDLLRHLPGTFRTNGFALFQAPTVVACFRLLMSDLPLSIAWSLAPIMGTPTPPASLTPSRCCASIPTSGRRPRRGSYIITPKRWTTWRAERSPP